MVAPPRFWDVPRAFAQESAAQGKDSKALDEEMLQKRREAAQARKKENDNKKEEMRKQNRQMSQKIHRCALPDPHAACTADDLTLPLPRQHGVAYGPRLAGRCRRWQIGGSGAR